MAFRETDNFDAPIPGQSLTFELGSRPWQTPPEYNTLEEALDYYLPRMTDKKYMGELLDIIETKIPLTSIADTLTLGGVMQGLHSVDVGILINPILVELMEGMAKNAEVEYTVGDDEGKENTPDKMLVSKAMKSLNEVDPTEMLEGNEVEEDTMPKSKNNSSGLMSRRGEV